MIRREDRAKQFAPFEALTGLRKALREKEIEHERTERVEVSEDRAERVERALKKAERGVIARVTYYDSGYYVAVEGEITEHDRVFRYIKIGDGKMFYDDIYDVRIISG